MNEIIIRGIKPSDCLRFVPHHEISVQSCEVHACVNGRTVTNDSLTLLNPDQFLEELNKFEQTRKAIATLEGTYDFHLTVRPCGHTGAAAIDFVVEDWFVCALHQERGRLSLKAGFELPGEMVLKMVQDFTCLFMPGARDD